MNIDSVINEIPRVKMEVEVFGKKEFDKQTERTLKRWIKWIGKKGYIDSIGYSRGGGVKIGFTIGRKIFHLVIDRKEIIEFKNDYDDIKYEDKSDSFVMSIIESNVWELGKEIKYRINKAYKQIKNMDRCIKGKLEERSYTIYGKIAEIGDLVGVEKEGEDYEIIVNTKIKVDGVEIDGRSGIMLSEIEKTGSRA